MKNESNNLNKITHQFIYVCGPYSPKKKDKEERIQEIKRNINKANEIGLEIVKKGHIPFIPHKMMEGWEHIPETQTEKTINRDQVMGICLKWINKCDALYFIEESKGANIEKEYAEKLGLIIYKKLSDLPMSKKNLTLFEKTKIDCYLKEYSECASSYRHTYSTIWQAGSILFATSGAMLAFGSDTNNVVQTFSLVPILFWWLGLFLPMDRYGEMRSKRLSDIEQELNSEIYDLKMAHFFSYEDGRKTEISEYKVKFWWRVKTAVNTFMICILILQIFLIAKWLLAF